MMQVEKIAQFTQWHGLQLAQTKAEGIVYMLIESISL